VAINVKTGMPPFGILANHKIKMCHNSMKKNDTKDYSEQLRAKKIVNQSSDFPVRRTGSYRHKKALGLVKLRPKADSTAHTLFQYGWYYGSCLVFV